MLFVQGTFLHNSHVTLENNEITLDFDVMKRSIKLLMLYEDKISSSIERSLNVLFKQIDSETISSKRWELENDANFLNIFFIIFHLPYLSDPGFIFGIASTFYLLLCKLSIKAQAKFVRVLVDHKNELKGYVGHVQQYITMHTVQWSEQVQSNYATELLLSNKNGNC